MYAAPQETVGHADNPAVKRAQKKENQEKLNSIRVRIHNHRKGQKGSQTSSILIE